MTNTPINSTEIDLPKVPDDDLEKAIANEQYCHFEGTTVTICLLTLRNGFQVVGESYCAIEELFDKTEGCQRAREHAKKKIWQLEAYLFRQQVYEDSAEGPNYLSRIE